MTGNGQSDQDSAGPRRVQALVLSGGGASGAYEVGVLKALFGAAERPLEPAVFAGTSIGSFNATFLVSQWDAYGRAAIANLEQTWLERMASTRSIAQASIIRVRGNPLDLLIPSAYTPNPLRPFTRLAGDGFHFFFEALSRASYLATGPESLPTRLANQLDLSAFLATEPWQEIIRSLDFAAIRRSSRFLRIAATNYQSGELKTFRNEDMTDAMGPLGVMASSAIPGLLPPVMIGSEPHVDGGVVMNTPLNLAIQARPGEPHPGELHVIYLDPELRQIPLSALNSTIDSSYRAQLIGWAKTMNENIDATRRINQSLRALDRLRRDPAASGIDFDGLEKELHTARLRPLVIHRYHPRDDLAGGALGLLAFQRDHIEHLIERGFEDGRHHDCGQSKCVLLEEDDTIQPVPSRTA
jgi:predicted acylesterase/phospholipase RssA